MTAPDIEPSSPVINQPFKGLTIVKLRMHPYTIPKERELQSSAPNYQVLITMDTSFHEHDYNVAGRNGA
jgi:hypothetical protein